MHENSLFMYQGKGEILCSDGGRRRNKIQDGARYLFSILHYLQRELVHPECCRQLPAQAHREGEVFLFISARSNSLDTCDTSHQ